MKEESSNPLSLSTAKSAPLQPELVSESSGDYDTESLIHPASVTENLSASISPTRASSSPIDNAAHSRADDRPLSNHLTHHLTPISNTAVDLADQIRAARILIVDDEPANLEMLQDMLSSAEYSYIKTTSDPHQVIALYHSFMPDLIMLDLMMPGLDGLQLMDLLHAEGIDQARIPILVLTADITPQAKRRALSKNAKDFITKPFDVVEMLLRIANLLENRFLHQGLQIQNTTLEIRVEERTFELQEARHAIAGYAAELEEAHYETLERLALAGEFRDDETGHHTQRVSFVTALMAERLGFSYDQVRWIQQAARLHDVGKIGISDLILLKPGKLTQAEFEIMKTHTEIGAQLLSGGRSELLQIAERIAHSHHERWDGNGYPHGLKGEEIPIEARLLSVADVFDALTHDRPYKSAWSVPEAVAEIQNQQGRQFDPCVVEIFLQLDHDALI